MAMHPEVLGLLHSFIASMPEAQTMDPSGQPAAGAAPVAAAPTQGTELAQAQPGGAQLGSFQQAVGTAQGALDQGNALAETTGQSMLARDNQVAGDQLASDTSRVANENEGMHAIAQLHKEFIPKIDALEASMQDATNVAREETKKSYDLYLRAASDFSQTHVYNWWAKASTGAQILGVLSQIAAGAAQGLNGQVGAKTPLDHIIDRDLEEQKMNLGQKGEAVQNAKGVYNDMRATLKDTVATGAASLEVAYNSVIQRATSLQALNKDAGAISRLDAVKAAYTTKIADNRNKYEQYTSEKMQAAAHTTAGVATQFAAMFGDPNAQKGQAATVGLSDVEGDTESLAKHAPTVFYDIQQKSAAGNNAITALVSLQQRLADPAIRKRESLADFNAKNNQLLSTFETNTNTIAKLGALSEADALKLLQQAGVGSDFGVGSEAKTYLPGQSYAAMASRVRGAVISLHGQVSSSISSIKVNGKPLRYTRQLPKGF